MRDESLLHRILALIEGRYYGKYHGFVVDNEDPKKRGRIRVLVPEVLGPSVVSGWAEPCFPYGGGPDYGHYSVPPVCKSADGKAYTTGVWVEFRGGDPQHPIWVGTFFGAPHGTSEAPGDDAEPDVNVHVQRTFAGHGIVAVDTEGSERFELRDAAGQRLTFSAHLQSGTKRDQTGNKNKETTAVDYPDLVANAASIALHDFAGNELLLDASKAAPTVTIKNTDRDGKVLQTIVLDGTGSGAQIVITDNNKNVITLSQQGIKIDALSGSDTIVLNKGGIKENAKKIDLNDGSMGAARLNDQVQSTMAEDPAFWTWVTTLMTWVQTHTHGSALGPTTPPVPPFPGSVPSKCVGKIIKASKTVVIGD